MSKLVPEADATLRSRQRPATGSQRPTDPQRLLEGRGLVLGVFDDGGVGAAALAAPHLLAAAGVPVLVGGLGQLGAHLHQVVGVGLHQGLGREQAQV